MLFEQYSDMNRLNTADSITNKIVSSVSSDAIVGGEDKGEDDEDTPTKRVQISNRNIKYLVVFFVLHGDTEMRS
jgi:hypothetical protein